MYQMRRAGITLRLGEKVFAHRGPTEHHQGGGTGGRTWSRRCWNLEKSSTPKRCSTRWAARHHRRPEAR